MTEQDIGRFEDLMRDLAENFSAPLSERRITFLFRELRGHPIEDIEAAVREVCRTRAYQGFPPLAEILQALPARPRNYYGLPADAPAEVRQHWQDYREMRRPDPPALAVELGLVPPEQEE
jgi:hypothetical protein